jgi:hypothetical protein
MKTMDEDIHRITEMQLAKAGIQDKMPERVRGRLLKPKSRVKAAMR